MSLCQDCVKGRPYFTSEASIYYYIPQVSPTRALLKVCYMLSRQPRFFWQDPKGKWEKICGVDSYVSTPTGDYPKDKAILFLPDVFGPQLINAQVRSFYMKNLLYLNRLSSSSLTTLLPTVSKLVVATVTYYLRSKSIWMIPHPIF